VGPWASPIGFQLQGASGRRATAVRRDGLALPVAGQQDILGHRLKRHGPRSPAAPPAHELSERGRVSPLVRDQHELDVDGRADDLRRHIPGRHGSPRPPAGATVHGGNRAVQPVEHAEPRR
jgi:hypothetical protein